MCVLIAAWHGMGVQVMMCVTFEMANSAAFVVHFLHKHGDRLPMPTTGLGWYAISAGLAVGAGIFITATTLRRSG